MKCKFSIITMTALFASAIYANTVVNMNLVALQGAGKSIGTIIAKDTPKGLLLTPNLHNLPPGQHGFHLHEFASCENNAMAAGEHFDPHHTHKHLGPYKEGHEGDLPFLTVDQNGKALQSVLAPHLKEIDLKGHSLIIHEGGDNYSDVPQKSGGGGPRIACGIIK